MTVACVLRSGGDFGPRWVDALRRGVNTHLKRHRFVCLTDDDGVGLWGERLAHGFQGWWSKVELFRPGLLTGRVLYLDLDTLPVGDLSEIAAYDGPLAVLSDFYQGSKMIGTGVMAWTPGEHTERIYRAFTEDAEGIMGRGGRSDHFYRRHMGDVDRLQSLFPGQIVTLKPIHGEHPDPKQHGPPEGARLVCGHGRPRLSDPAAGWAHRLWRDRANGQRRAA